VSRLRGEKFVDKYATNKFEVATATIYKVDPDLLKIPGRDHPLYDPTAPTVFDELRVRAIDRDGHMNDPIEVWTDPDIRSLWVLDGRGRTLDVREVNRRRREDSPKREPIQVVVTVYPGKDEKAAVKRVFEKNYHRRQALPSHMAEALRKMRQRGVSFEDAAAALHVETENAEAWGRLLLPLAYCCPEVQAAIDAGEIPRTSARRYGGSAPDGSKALGRGEQVNLLEKALEGKKDAAKTRPDAIGSKQRERLCAVLANGGVEKLKGADLIAALAVRGTLARLSGHKGALDRWPAVKELVEAALAAQPKGPKAKESAAEKLRKIREDAAQKSF
jgi:hypothetical protein